MNDDTPDWRDDRPGDEGGYERPRQEAGRNADRRANDPRFTDTRPPSTPDDGYGAGRDSANGASRSSSPRERLSADYDDEPVFRRRSAGAGGGLSALIGSDVMTRRLVYGAAGLGAILVLGVGGWSLMGGHSGGIPVIGPPPGPVRDRPADPGGMQIMADGSDLDVTGQGEAHLAPEPEQPRPEALAARTAPEAPPAQAGETHDTPASQDAGGTAKGVGPEGSAPRPASQQEPGGKADPAAAQDQGGSATASGPDPSGASAPQAGAAQNADMPARPSAPKTASADTQAGTGPVAPTAPQAAPTRSEQSAPAAASPAPRTAAGTHMVQLAALGSDADARTTWGRLSRQASDLLADHEPVIEQKTINGHVFYRLRVGGFDSAQAARSFCVRLHARSIACTPAVF